MLCPGKARRSRFTYRYRSRGFCAPRRDSPQAVRVGIVLFFRCFGLSSARAVPCRAAWGSRENPNALMITGSGSPA